MLIANLTAGAGRGNRKDVVALAARDLQRHGFEVKTCIEKSPQEVSARAASAALKKTSVIVAAGGDGTVNAVVNGMMEASTKRGELRALSSQVALGILPMGTGNVFAYNMNIPNYWRDACRVIESNHRRRIDLGRAVLLSHKGERSGRKRFFLLMAGIGFDAKVMEDTSLRLKYVLRDFAYVLSSLQNAVTYRGTHITLTLDGKPVYSDQAWMVMVGNAASYAWDIRFTAKARLDDGVLDVCLMPYANKLISVQQVMQLLMGQHIESGSAKYWQMHRLQVHSEPPVPVQLDGDEWSITPLELEVHPGALEVLAPEKSKISLNLQAS
jgi:YegS/Rv2252/BmrU family lipid kinase